MFRENELMSSFSKPGLPTQTAPGVAGALCCSFSHGLMLCRFKNYYWHLPPSPAQDCTIYLFSCAESVCVAVLQTRPRNLPSLKKKKLCLLSSWGELFASSFCCGILEAGVQLFLYFLNHSHGRNGILVCGNDMKDENAESPLIVTLWFCVCFGTESVILW